MFEEESRRGTYVYASLGVVALIVLVSCIVLLWPSSERSVSPNTYVGSCGDSFCDPFESKNSTCSEDCGSIDIKEVEEKEEEVADEESGTRVVDTDFLGFDDETAEFSITVGNNGVDIVDPFTVEVALMYDGAKVDTCLQPIAKLDSGDTKPVSCFFTVGTVLDDLSESDDEVVVDLDISFLDVTDTESFTWDLSAVSPDLVVDSISYSVEDNSTMEVTVTVKNMGAVAVEDSFYSSVTLYVDDEVSDTCSSLDTEISQLGVDEDMDFICEIELDDDVAELVVDEEVPIRIVVEVDSEDDISEFDEDNNEESESDELKFSDFS